MATAKKTPKTKKPTAALRRPAPAKVVLAKARPTPGPLTWALAIVFGLLSIVFVVQAFYYYS